ncbi:MAG TPA: hypothetical protein VFG10_03975 [Saprospiraceae bacterium]|nr:hypothetical protein [Saprospiraceae bacterium]
MKWSLSVIILNLLFIGISCKNQLAGIYAGELESGVKHLSSSLLELKTDKSFKLTYSTTSLESTVPSTSISEWNGRFEKNDDQIKLILETKKVNWLSYGKNPDSLNFSSAGGRRTALVVIDTFYGQVQPIENDKLIILNLASKLNSKYLWNEQNCFIKFNHSDVSHDLNNYCSEFRTEKWTDQ